MTSASPDPLLAPYAVLARALPIDWHAIEAWSSTFYPFQRRWLFDNARLAIACKSRQIGWSHTAAATAVLWGAFRGETTTIISIGKRESAEVLDKCARHVKVLQALGSTMSKTESSSKEEIRFVGGGAIIALPSEAGRSYSGNVVLDEFAYQQHADAVWDGAAPVTMHGFKLRIISTPNGVGNAFHRLWREATKIPLPGERRSGWSAHEVPLSVAVDQGMTVDMENCWDLAHNDPRLFEQMFACSFLDNVLQYLSTAKIDQCRWARAMVADGKGRYYAGLDIGREADLTCLVVLRVLNGISEVVHVETMPRTDSDGLDAMIDWAFDAYALKRLCVDATGLGTFPSDRMKKRHGDRVEVPHRRNKVEAVTFTPKSKELLASSLYDAFTNQKIRIPAEDAHLPAFERRNKNEKGDEVGDAIPVNQPGTASILRQELASIRRIITGAGNITYDSPRTQLGHGDRAWALALAIFAIDQTHPMVEALTARIAAGVPIVPR